MKNKNIPSDENLPSMAKLIKSTILAICIAAILLVTVVLPAEYGIDPISVGEMIGLTKMGQIKASLSQEAALEDSALAKSNTIIQEEQIAEPTQKETVSNNMANLRNDKISLTLEPNEGKEIKLTMAAGKTVNYQWYTDGSKANFDAHADSKVLQIKYHNYEKGQLAKSEGVLEAAFDGNHGWFWRNRTSETMTVTLEVGGNYTDVLQF